MTAPELAPPFVAPHYADLPTAVALRSLKRDPVFDVAEELAVERLAPPSIGKPRIVSSAHGPLRHLLLWFPSYPSDLFDLAPVYGDLLESLPASTRVTIAAHPEAIEVIEAIARERRPDSDTDTFSTPPWLSFTVWAEDAFVVVEDVSQEPPTTYLLEPRDFPRAGDQVLAEQVATAAGMRVGQVPLNFQGGNILIGDDFVLIGADYLDESVAIAPEVFEDLDPGSDVQAYVATKFRELFDPDREVHFLRSRPNRPRPPERRHLPDGRVFDEVVYNGEGRQQPIFHIDMFVSLAGRAEPGGRYRVLVGDPSRAAKILGTPLTPYDLQSEFDDIAGQLSGLDFEVIRSPLPRAYYDEAPVGEPIRRTWYHPTSNNCLVQIDGNSRDVWLPTYGHGPWRMLKSTDQAIQTIWQDLGFTCHQLGDFHPFASRLGALHCIKKYLSR